VAKRQEIKSQFLKFFFVLVVATKNYFRVKGLNKFAAKGLNVHALYRRGWGHPGHSFCSKLNHACGDLFR